MNGVTVGDGLVLPVMVMCIRLHKFGLLHVRIVLILNNRLEQGAGLSGDNSPQSEHNSIQPGRTGNHHTGAFTYAQGFYYSEALTAEVATAFIRENRQWR